MIILGLHFGHDAAVAVMDEGRLVTCVLRERLTRVKHALGLDVATVEAALDDAGLTPADVDLCAVTSTQGIELISFTPDELLVTLEPHSRHTIPSPITERSRRRGDPLESSLSSGFLEWVRGPVPEGGDARALALRSKAYFPEHAERSADTLGVLGSFDRPLVPHRWTEETGLRGIVERGLDGVLAEESLRFGMHLPVTVRLMGRPLGGYLVHHHLAHAASVFFPSGLEQGLVLTHDGWRGDDAVNGGLYWLGRGTRLCPLAPHYLSIGALYEQVGYRLGLGASGQEGKLMGLAPYGAPAFYDERYVGNRVDAGGAGSHELTQGWFRHCVAEAERAGYDMTALADPERITEPVNADVAASTQEIFEVTLLRAVRALRDLVAGSEAEVEALCLAGGTALNCPANTRIWREGGFETTVVPPWTDDSGMALGAALALHHALLDAPRTEGSSSLSPYLGLGRHEAALPAALDATEDLDVTEPPDAAAEAARDLAGGRVIAWYEGRSELGPRALGHRSILADPRDPENWRRVNRVKSREAWRPLAPAVLEERAGEWFTDCPVPAPHMLFTARVRGSGLPAVTHVDRSARIQTVGPSLGGYRTLLERFDSETGCPVLLNTSFNGPGEPIVESPREALDLFRRSALDVLYLAGRRVRKPS